MRLYNSYPMTVTRIWARVSNGTACFSRNYTPPSPHAVESVETIGRYREVVKGNKVRATPYTCEVFECEPITGTYTQTIATRYGPNVNHVKHCGPSAGTFFELAGSAGAVFNGASIIPQLPGDLETEQFLMNYSRTQALQSLRKSYVNLPLLYAERVQTAKMLTDNCLKISKEIGDLKRDAIKQYKRAKQEGRRAKDVAKALADKHLEYLFGVLPLLDEMKGAVEMFYKPESMVITGRGKRASVDEIDTSFSLTHKDYNSFVSKPWQPSLRCKVGGFDRLSARTSISVEVTTRAIKRMRDLGFNPLAAAFDLVPLSFLANFVSNLGAFIGSHDPMPDAVFLRGSTGLWREAVRQYVVIPEPFLVYSSFDMWVLPEASVCSARGSGRALKIVRFPFDGMPDPTLLLANNLSVEKAFTVSALAIQRAIKPVIAAKRALKPFRYRGARPKNLKPIRYEP